MSLHSDARNAGLGPRDTARYLAYVAMRLRKGAEPITPLDAARQVREARGESR